MFDYGWKMNRTDTENTLSASPPAEDAACVCQDRKKISADVKQKSGLASDGSVKQSVAVFFFFNASRILKVYLRGKRLIIGRLRVPHSGWGKS